MPVRIYDELPVLLSYGAHFCPFYYSNPYLKPDFLLLLTVTCNDQNYKEGGGVCACACVCVERAGHGTKMSYTQSDNIMTPVVSVHTWFPP